MIALSRRCEDTLNDREFSEDQLRVLAAERLARLIAENVCDALRAVTDGVLDTATRDARASTRAPLVDAITPGVLDLVVSGVARPPRVPAPCGDDFSTAPPSPRRRPL